MCNCDDMSVSVIVIGYKEVRLISAILDASRCNLEIHDSYKSGWNP